MRQSRLAKLVPGSLFVLLPVLLFSAACGSNNANGGNVSSTATACVQATRTGTVPASSFANTVGTLKSINGQTLVVTTREGADTTVTYTSSTRFTQESVVAATDLQKGTNVRVVVTSNNGTYEATTITVVERTNNNGGNGNNNNGGFPGGGNGTPGARNFNGNGTPGARNNPCFNRNRFATPGSDSSNFRGIIGTVAHVSSKSLAVTDTAGQTYTVTITTQTQIIETKSVTAAALKVGQPLQVNGTNKQGVVTANTVAILLSLPERPATPTPTP